MSDYKEYIKEIGLTENQVQTIVNQNNVIELENTNYYKKQSEIHGIGVFASRDIKKGDIIGDVTISDKYRTTLGRWVNHCKNKNTKFHHYEEGLVAIAEKDIAKNKEILIDYRDHTLNDPKFIKYINEFKKLMD